MMRQSIATLVRGDNLSQAEMESAMGLILGGEATAAQIAAFVVARTIKGETSEELATAARVMRRHAVPVRLGLAEPVIDTCGTGGDNSGSINISTLSAIVVAACGVKVAKHGNRAATSKAGSADLLEALGVSLDATPAQVERCIAEVGIGFMFARAHHPAMRHAAPVRAEIGIRTLFNFLGPLSNPASPSHQLLGVGDGSKLDQMAQVLGLLGTTAAWVVHGDGGLDEISLSGPTQVAKLVGGSVERDELVPEDFGVERAPLAALAGGDAKANAAIGRAILEGDKGAPRDAVVINAAGALCVVGAASDPLQAAERAQEALDSGAAKGILARWVAMASGS